MNEDENTRGTRRYVALDIHKHYSVVAGVDRDARVLLQPVCVEHADLEGWLKKHLCSSDQVVIESTTNAWHVYDLLSPLVERVVVANPIRVKQIAQARVTPAPTAGAVKQTFETHSFLPGCWLPTWFQRCGYRLPM